MGRRSSFSLLKFSSFTLTCALFLISFYIDCRFVHFGACSKLRLVPGAICPPNFQIYRFLTFFLVNSSLILLTSDVLGFLIFDIFVYNRWNLAERVKYLLMCSWIPGLLCLVYYYIKFANSKTEADIYATYISGSSAFVAAVLVVVKQLSSESMGGRYSLLLHHYSALTYLAVVLSLSLVEVIPPISCLYSFLGFLVGWTYLRFAQKHTDGKRGDFRTSFAFVRFFPPFVQPVLAIPVNLIYAVVVAFGLCPKVGQQYEIISASTFASADIARAGFSSKDHYK
ncbi:unnamed protein product [Schistocephalus solidus]|uniref:Transmembrane protein 115 n=1 Tax=Schistocephalus solidus TaxID=70667 RepID=A0A183SRM2_SCHSO|nr:unnamed protein product [Schistocephalus solidus]